MAMQGAFAILLTTVQDGYGAPAQTKATLKRDL